MVAGEFLHKGEVLAMLDELRKVVPMWCDRQLYTGETARIVENSMTTALDSVAAAVRQMDTYDGIAEWVP